MTEILFFRDDEEVAQAGATYDLAVASEGKLRAANKAAEALVLANSAHDKLTAVNKNAGELSAKLTRLKDEYTSETRTFFEAALLETHTDHEAAAGQLARLAQPIAGLTGALEFFRASLLPELNLATLRADSALFSEFANLAGWSVLESAVIRHEASRSLADADGIVTFGAIGRTHDLLVASIEAHRRAGEAVAAVAREEQKQKAIQELR